MHWHLRGYLFDQVLQFGSISLNNRAYMLEKRISQNRNNHEKFTAPIQLDVIIDVSLFHCVFGYDEDSGIKRGSSVKINDQNKVVICIPQCVGLC